MKIALAGNPNSGKTTLFNALTGSNQFVGNWPGVTVEKKEGRLRARKEVRIIDLPGIYSLSPYTIEEEIARRYLEEERPDVIIDIIDGTNLERNLYLTTQLLEFGIPVIAAVNLIDEVEKSGDVINLARLEAALGCPVLAISALKNRGLTELAEKALVLAKEKNAPEAPVMPKTAGGGEDPETLLAEARYAFISKALAGAYRRKRNDGLSLSDKIDRVLTNRFFALPIFAAVIFFIYYVSVTTVGAWVTGWTNDGLFGKSFSFLGLRAPGVPVLIGGLLEMAAVSEWLRSLVIDGITAGVGAVIGFVPQMFVLFLFLAALEACGYMARIAFILDRIFRRFGLSGKSFIPMLIGTGCGIPGVMASRTIENEKDRRLTIMTTTFMPCGAKLPIIALISGAVLDGAWWVAPSSYFLGIASVICSGIMLKKTKPFSGEAVPFVMELPAYRFPGVINVLRSMWERGWSFIKKAGSIILLSSVVVWFLSSFGFTDGRFGMTGDLRDGLLASIGRAIAFIFAPLGFGSWDAAVATITGLVAKENVVGTMGVLYGFAETAEDGAEIWGTFARNFSAAGAYAFLVFNLYCPPCFAAIGAIRREMNNGRWTAFAVGYQLAYGYILALIVYQLGSFVLGGSFGAGTAAGFAALALLVRLLTRRPKARTGSGNAFAQP
ncbi:MAG: ferrous iron transporter B [Treponema sp.]|nr:ferrous iron transporter B [Treponema sp.]